jgi:hypothetical protein
MTTEKMDAQKLDEQIAEAQEGIELSETSTTENKTDVATITIHSKDHAYMFGMAILLAVLAITHIGLWMYLMGWAVNGLVSNQDLSLVYYGTYLMGEMYGIFSEIQHMQLTKEMYTRVYQVSLVLWGISFWYALEPGTSKDTLLWFVKLDAVHSMSGFLLSQSINWLKVKIE